MKTVQVFAAHQLPLLQVRSQRIKDDTHARENEVDDAIDQFTMESCMPGFSILVNLTGYNLVKKVV